MRLGTALAVMSLVVGTWTTAPSSVGAQEVADPLEGFNRRVFRFNQVLDDNVVEPVARGYRRALPQPVRTGVGNFFNNLASPIYLANNILQGDVDGASVTLQRFLLNTTAGLGGFIDQATPRGIVANPEDFGQTLGVWGVGDAPYLVLPLFGPSNPRDASGMAVDTFALDPTTYLLSTPVNISLTVINLIDTRASLIDQLDSLEESSFDFYASIRSVYYQSRRAAVADGQVTPSNDLYDDVYDLDDEEYDVGPTAPE